MEKFGEKAYLLLKENGTLKAAIGWQVENLVSRATEMVLDPELPMERILPVLIQEMERASQILQCEASLIFTRHQIGSARCPVAEIGLCAHSARIVAGSRLAGCGAGIDAGWHNHVIQKITRGPGVTPDLT